MTMTRQGIDLAAAEANAAGGIDGRPVRIRWVDDDASGVKAVSIARSLVADRQILAVIGHESSAAMLAAARIYDGHLAAVSPSATSPDLTGLSSWVFRVVPSDSTNGQALARFAQGIGAKRVAIFYENDAYGRGLARSFRRNVVGTVVTSDPIAAAASTYEPYVAYLKQLQPDLVFVAGLGASGLGLLREAKRQGLKASFLGSEGWAGIERDTAAAEGAYVAAPFAAEDPRPAVRRFVTAFEARFHTVPREDAALGYDVTQLLIQAAHEGLATRRGVRDYIASLSPERSFKGVTGSLRFLPNGDPLGQKFVMTRVHQGSYQVTGTY
jgi:branched-chain amino acid transport system substrate-binding protein